MIQRRKRHRVGALCLTVFALMLLGVAIITIQRVTERGQRESAINETDFNLKRIKRTQKKKPTKNLVKKRNQMKKKLRALKPILSADLSGASFGLDLGDMNSVDLDSELLEGNQDVIMDEDSVDQRPRALEKPPVEFPERALADNILKGIIELRMLITKKGIVEDVEILSASPKGYFEDAALSMVASWSFQPAKYAGRPVAIWAKQVVRFGE